MKKICTLLLIGTLLSACSIDTSNSKEVENDKNTNVKTEELDINEEFVSFGEVFYEQHVEFELLLFRFYKRSYSIEHTTETHEENLQLLKEIRETISELTPPEDWKEQHEEYLSSIDRIIESFLSTAYINRHSILSNDERELISNFIDSTYELIDIRNSLVYSLRDNRVTINQERDNILLSALYFFHVVEHENIVTQSFGRSFDIIIQAYYKTISFEYGGVALEQEIEKMKRSVQFLRHHNPVFSAETSNLKNNTINYIDPQLGFIQQNYLLFSKEEDSLVSYDILHRLEDQRMEYFNFLFEFMEEVIFFQEDFSFEDL